MSEFLNALFRKKWFVFRDIIDTIISFHDNLRLWCNCSYFEATRWEMIKPVFNSNLYYFQSHQSILQTAPPVPQATISFPVLPMVSKKIMKFWRIFISRVTTICSRQLHQFLKSPFDSSCYYRFVNLILQLFLAILFQMNYPNPLGKCKQSLVFWMESHFNEGFWTIQFQSMSSSRSFLTLETLLLLKYKVSTQLS